MRAVTGSLVLICATGCPDPTPTFTEPRTLGGVEVSAETLNTGAHLYTMRCASCHGNDGSGQGPGTSGLKEAPRDFRTGLFEYKSTPGDELPTDADLAATIRNGRLEAGMPAWPAMPEDDRSAVIQYIKTFSPRWSAQPEEKAS